MSIENPKMLFLLLLLIPLIILFVIRYYLGIKDLRAISQGADQVKFTDIYFKKIFFSAFFFSLVIIFLILTLAEFKWKKEYITEQPTGVDVSFVVDISNSMLADDLLPSRLERVKRVVSILLEQNRGFRYSMVLFKGSAIQQIPMTEDAAGFISWVNILSPGMITTPGTSISKGLMKAIYSFPSGKETRKVIILFSDGGADKIRKEQDLERLLAEKKIRLIVVGCGTEDGGIVRFDKDRILLDNNNKPMILKLKKEPLKYLAEIGKGDYCEIDNPEIVDFLINEMNKESSFVGVVDYSVRRPSQYKPFLLITLFWLGCFIYVRNKKFKGLF